MTVPPAPGHAGRVPIDAEMVGGFADGRRLQVPDPPPHHLVLVAPMDHSVLLDLLRTGNAYVQPGDYQVLYEHAGVRDDGTRWYRHTGTRFPAAR